MNKLSTYVLLLLVSVLAACSSDDDAAATFTPETPQPGDALAVTITASDFVTDGDPDTRATDNGKGTTFEDGDRVGIIILNKDKNLLYNNIPYKYVSSNQPWVFDSNNGEGKEICYYDSKAKTYIVYYPYHKDADGCKNESDLKAIFKPQPDQSTKDAYRASDLMVYTTTDAPKPSLTAVLRHVYASLSLSPVVKYTLDDEKKTEYIPASLKISDVNLTIGDALNVPYQAPDGSLRCILPADITPGDIRCFYTFSGTTYGNTINISAPVAANTRYTSAPEIINKYTLDDAKVGDFYCRNSKNEGYLIPGDVVALTDDQKTACLGIVMKVGKDAEGDWKDDCDYKLKNTSTAMNTIHGYVLALHNANNSVNPIWAASNVSVGTNTEETTGFYGYNNTQVITKYGSQNGLNLQNSFPATYHATDGYEIQYSAPTNSSGWFLPSAGQCLYWSKNKGAIWTSMDKAGGDGWTMAYWSSSEDSTNKSKACYLGFGSGRVGKGTKSNTHTNSVRSCLAF